MPPGPWLYPADQVTDAPLRLFAAEITREKMFERLHEELPYQTTVETDSWTTLPDGSARIEQSIFVTRDGHKKIVIGEGGQTLKSIGKAARRDIGEAAECNVHLFLHVKVREKLARRSRAVPRHGPGVPQGEELILPRGAREDQGITTPRNPASSRPGDSATSRTDRRRSASDGCCRS